MFPQLKYFQKFFVTGMSLILILASCLPSGQTGQLKDLEWILGSWERTNGKPGQVQMENWEQVSESRFDGIGVRMQGSDTLFVEYLSIRAENDHIYYVAEVAENPAPVKFKITSLANTQFVSENPEHDDPKRIAYFLSGQELKVEVSGDDGGFEVLFVKVE